MDRMSSLCKLDTKLRNHLNLARKKDEVLWRNIKSATKMTISNIHVHLNTKELLNHQFTALGGSWKLVLAARLESV